MPRPTKPPVPLKEPLAPADPVEAVRCFKREAKLAACHFVNDPKDGQLRALKALIRHSVALFQDDDDPLVLCMIKSLAAEHYPRKPNAHSPWLWMQRARIAAALDAMLLLPGTDEHKAAEAIHGELKKLGITLNKNRNEKFNADVIVNLRKNYLSGAADEAAIKLFGYLRFEREIVFHSPNGTGDWHSAVLDDLRFHLRRLTKETPDGRARR